MSKRKLKQWVRPDILAETEKAAKAKAKPADATPRKKEDGEA